jgi:hypothetical protein
MCASHFYITIASTCSGSLTKFTYFGVNESGAEFGTVSVKLTKMSEFIMYPQNIPGALGTDYVSHVLLELRKTFHDPLIDMALS